MAGILTASRSHDVALQGAILLYGPKEGEFSYATAHRILYEDGAARPAIGAGVPLNRKALIHAVAQVVAASLPKGEFLPPNVLSISTQAVAWWTPPAKRRVFFDCEELGARSAIVPHPGLVFQAVEGGFRVFSLHGEDRPTPDTALYEPPYFNTWDHGQICIGSAHIPKQIDVASMPGWEEAFFSSAFTHPNHGGQRVKFDRGAYAFWKDMLDGKFPEFPKEVLVPMNKTLGDLIARPNGGFF
ncbi:PRTRC system protein B [Ralstonia nicotianae]|uniref:PRTRC system protein B n=1 Tax=Ralstonia pseudosolanacearum TaxID=1310165 RepID=UPI002006288D|nr:PRTRC system protein B [Ralstonia pseudosolanacearum]MCK4118360.1 PRTRC system protein B [Ralstonia pseudosolanacearum]